MKPETDKIEITSDNFLEHAVLLEKSFEYDEEKEINNQLPYYVQSLKVEAQTETDEGKKLKYKEIEKFIEPFFFDAGACRETEVKLTVDGQPVVYNAPAINLLNRSGFLSHLEESFKGPGDAFNHAHIYLFDLKNFRAADKVLLDDSNQDTNPADVMVNKVGGVLLKRASLINELMGSRVCTVGRYGGDEFAVLLENVDDLLLRAEMLNYLYKDDLGGIESIEGFYLANGSNIRGKIELKDQGEGKKFSEVKIPADRNLQLKFWEYMRRGVLLDEKELEKISDTELPGVRPDETLSQRMDWFDYIFKKHPELVSVEQALEGISNNPYDEEQTKTNLIHHLENFEKFIKNHYYDRLLGEKVSSMANFYKQSERTPFSRLYVIDTKQVKEINDNFSIAHGDMAIFNTWEQISKILGNDPTIFNGLHIFRRGGMIIIAETENGRLSEEKSTALSSLNSTFIQSGREQIDIGVASNVIEIRNKDQTVNQEEMRSVLNKLLAENEMKWYKRIIEQNLDNPEFFEFIKNPPTDLSSNLLWLHLHSEKRKRERLEKAYQASKELIEEESSSDVDILASDRFDKLAAVRNMLEEGISGVPIFERD